VSGSELEALARGLRHTLERRRALGIERIPAAPPAAARPAAAETATAGTRAAERPPTQPSQPAASQPARRAPEQAAPRAQASAAPTGVAALREAAAACQSLAELEAKVSECTACSLCETRTQTVFADGDGSGRVLFVGEAPGENEDLQGVPFVGRAGALLTDIIEKGMGIPRSSVTIANILKCRPPQNRDPSSEEKALCTAWLDRQIELLDPGMIIALGRHAAGHLLATDSSLGRLRGRIHERSGRKIIVTYHPAFLLRSPGMKRDCWQDIQLAMRELGLEPPARGGRS